MEAPVKKTIKVPNSAFYIGLVGVISYVFSQVFGAIYNFNSIQNSITDFPFEFGAPMHRSLSGDMEPFIGNFMEAAIKTVYVIALVICAVYISIFLAFLIRGRSQPLNKTVFVVYLVFSSLGLFGHLVSIPSLVLMGMEPSFYTPFYYIGELFGFVATVCIFVSCLIFIIQHGKAPQPVQPQGYFYTYGPYVQAYPVNPYIPVQPVVPPAPAPAAEPQNTQTVRPDEGTGVPCAVCGKLKDADSAFCPHCGAPKA